MKTTRLLAFAACLGLLSIAHADTIILSDTFDGPFLDSSKWNTILPLGISSISQSGGNLTTAGRGILATVADVNGPYTINGVFTMNNNFEHFNVAFRTGLSTPGAPFYERQGMLVAFSNDGNEISIQRYSSPTDWDLLAVTSFSLSTGQAYSFSIFDNGTDISLAVNGVDLLNANNTYSTGNHVAFYSREFSSTSTSIDSVIINHVPDGGMTALYLGLGLIVLVTPVSLLQRERGQGGRKM